MAQRHIILKAKNHGDAGKQVYSDKFMDYDYAWYLTDWLNKHNGDNFIYWLDEVDA